jgi:integral membrane sensor domain MASE1
MATGNTLEALVGSQVLHKYRLHLQLAKLSDVVIFSVFGAVLATLISASIGTTSLFLGGLINSNQILQVWTHWWVGDMLGILVVAPLIFSWYNQPTAKVVGRQMYFEFSVWLIFFLITAAIVFFSNFAQGMRTFFLPYLILPSVVWMTLRFHRTVIATAVLALAIFAVWGTSLRLGPFQNENIAQALIVSQIYIGVITVSILVFSAEVHSRKAAEEEILRLNETLKAKIAEEKRLNLLMVEHVKKNLPKKKPLARSNEIEVDIN